MMKYLQKLGKSLMLPVAVLPIAGILSGIGYWLCPSTMQGGVSSALRRRWDFSLYRRRFH